jgi:K+-transporting ATPase ATPase C chain
VTQFVKANPVMPKPNTVDLAVVFFQNFSDESPGKFPGSVMRIKNDGSPAMSIMPVSTGPDIQSIFFDMWREDHPEASLQDLPGDLVTTSASGLDPHITLDNANYQLDRVVSKWASDLKRDQASVQREIEEILQANASAPFGGLAGEKLINVLEINLELRKRFGAR